MFLFRALAACAWVAAGPWPSSGAIVVTTNGVSISGEITLANGTFNVGGRSVTPDELSLLDFRARSLPLSSTNSLPRAAVHLATETAPTNIPSQGLRGEYYNDRELWGWPIIRYDARLDFEWGTNSPMPGIRNHDFSVRWTGLLVAPTNAVFTFHIYSNDGARFWLGDVLVFDTWDAPWPYRFTSQPLLLKAGARYPFRLHYFNAGGTSALKLSWSTPTTPVAVIPANCFIPSGSPKAEGVLSQPFLVAEHALPAGLEKTPAGAMNGQFQPGVFLTSGSFIPRQVRFADESGLRFSDHPEAPVIPIEGVACMVFQPASPRALAKVPPGCRGVLLQAEEMFLEGEFKGVSTGKVKVSSVLFGIREYRVGEVLAVILRDISPGLCRFEITTQDGWKIMADSFRVEPYGLVMQHAGLTGLKLPLGLLDKIKRCQ